MIRHSFFVLSLFIVLSSVVATAMAQGLPLLPESSADYTFGQDIRFSLVAHNAGDVERITLYFRPELSSNSYEVDLPFEPGETVSVSYTVDANALELMPFRDVSYWWELDTREKSQSVPQQRFTYEDDRFAWQSSTDGQVAVHWTGDDPTLNERVQESMDAALDKLLETVAVKEVGPLDVYVYPSSADLRAALALTGIEDSRAEQLATDVLLVTSVNPQTAEFDLAQSVPYELAQMVLFRVAGNEYESIPWWLREGIAIRTQLIENPRYAQILENAAAADQTIPLQDLCDSPQSSSDIALLASAQSESLLRFIEEEHTPAATNQLLAAYLNGADCEDGVESILGQTLNDLELAWLSSLDQPTSMGRFINTYGIWILLSLAGGALALILLWASRSKERAR